MGDNLRNDSVDRDTEQAVTALKKGACLLKYGRRGKPKFCPFRLSVDETVLVWYVGKVEKQLKLNNVSKIIPGQRTAVFQRYPQPDKEYQSFSLLYNDRSLDLICKDKDEAEVWFVGLKALISHGNQRKKLESRIPYTDSPNTQTSISGDIFHKGLRDAQCFHTPPCDNPSSTDVGTVFSDVILYTAPKSSVLSDSLSNSLSSFSSGGADNSNGRSSEPENLRVSLSSALSSSSHGSGREDFDALGDVFIWGEGIGDGVLGGGLRKSGSPSASKMDAPLPKALEAAVVLDIHHVACGSRHAALVTKQGEVHSWGEESGGRLGHGLDVDVSHPKSIDALGGMNIDFVACGEYHTCAVTSSGDLYTWGDGIHNSGLLGHGSEASHWIPRLVAGPLEGLHVSSVSCGPWHTAVVTSAGHLLTFGDGIFGALGHGDRRSINMPREVEALKGMRTVRTACGVWHTAAIVEFLVDSTDSANSPSSKLFTWGDGDKGRLGHGDQEPRLIPGCVATLAEPSFCQVACGHDITIALSTSGRVFTMGSFAYGQLGNPEADGKLPTCVDGNLCDNFVEEITCGAYHAAVLTSKAEVYTWGKGANGQLGLGDYGDRGTPTLVEALKGKQVKSVVCGSNFTAVICLHKWVSGADLSICSGCHLPFGFRRKRHNCYNCGLVFCKSCSSRKSVKASLAPHVHKPYRVCDECYTKIKKAIGSGLHPQISKHPNGNQTQISSEQAEKETTGSRLSSVNSFKGEKKHKQKCKSEPNNCRLSGSSQWRSIYISKSPDVLYSYSKKIFPASVPGSRIESRSASPVTSLPSPPFSTVASTVTGRASSEVVADDSKNIDDRPSETVRLQLQVKDLTQKAQLLEFELEKISRELSEAMAIAGEETSKSKALKEAIKAHTTQLKDIKQRVPGGIVISSNGTLTEEIECVEQDELGVHITVSPSPGGKMYLKRVRFSRERFNEQQAERWWAENKAMLQNKYIFSSGESSTEPSSGSSMKDEISY